MSQKTPAIFDISPSRRVRSTTVGEESWRNGALETPFVFVAILWFGILLGVSFLATTVKFQAPSLDIFTALDVGRVTFALFSKVEWVLCALLIAAALLSRRARRVEVTAGAALAVVLFVQAAWLLPVLDARVDRILAGATVPATGHHLLYIAADSLKALLLLAVAVQALGGMAGARGVR